jgi:hypothetical protein
MSIRSLYRLMFGKRDPVEGDVISMSEHGRAGGTSNDQGFKFVNSVDTSLKYVIDGSDVYVAESKPGAVLTEAVWKVYKFTNADGTITYAGGNSNYVNPADDIKNLVYS